MPRIIFKCRYLKKGTAHAGNLVTYIAVREGVEKIPQKMRNRPATQKQKQLIAEVLEKFPDSAGLFEYEDYLARSTIENASEFISSALDQNIDQLTHQEIYVNYIATRLQVERLDTHGLFSDEDIPLVLSKVSEEVAGHTGNVWTPIISLRREDAARLGYDHAVSWMALLRKQRNVFAEQMKIDQANLRWYAAFHNEGHHPHCHMIIYSVNPGEGYVSKAGIEKMRSSLAREIFRQDLLQIYENQTVQRNALTKQSKDTLQELLKEMQTGASSNPVLEEMLSRLADRLRYLKGKKQYGYLKAPLKALVNQIVDELEKDERVGAIYTKWLELRNEVLRTYKNELPPPMPLSQQKEFKQIKNIVIAEAVKLGTHQFILEGEESPGPSPEEVVSEDELNTMEDVLEGELLSTEPESLSTEAIENQEDGIFLGFSDSPTASETEASGKPYIAWNDGYQEAKKFLFGNEDTEPDFPQALMLFLEEAKKGNALAMYDLGRMYADGLGMEIDTDASFSWYEKALDAFKEIEGAKAHRYVEYRIGKMYTAGLGTEQDYEEGAGWLQMAASQNHKYAQYTLAELYYRGQGVEQSYKTAFGLYEKSARQRVPYASYELGKMYRDGIGTVPDAEEAQLHFEDAFYGFQALEKQSHDDKLQYRLGHMLYTGTGTEIDIDAAIGYFEKAARLGNVHAQYMLGKLYLDENIGYGNGEKAIEWLSRAADAGSALAQYALGKLYRDGSHVEKDIEKAVTLFTLSAEQDNSYAAYALGKLYLLRENIPRDMEAAVKWLTLSADLGNQFAQYTLAKQYLTGESILKDIPKAVELFRKSALQNNPFAQYQLGRLYLAGEDVLKDVKAAIKWLTASAEQGNQYAQYALGKLLLIGRDVPRDREAAVRWLTLSAEQGNIYAQFLLNHLDSFRDPSPFLAATRLLHHLSRIFQEEQQRLSSGPGMQTDSKLRRKLRQKKIAQGHAPEDHGLKETSF